MKDNLEKTLAQKHGSTALRDVRAGIPDESARGARSAPGQHPHPGQRAVRLEVIPNLARRDSDRQVAPTGLTLATCCALASIIEQF